MDIKNINPTAKICDFLEYQFPSNHFSSSYQSIISTTLDSFILGNILWKNLENELCTEYTIGTQYVHNKYWLFLSYPLQ